MKYLKFTIFLITLFILLAFKEAHAAFILQRPLYLGLGSGLVGNWTFDGPDMAGVTAYDRSGQSPANNGTLTGGPARALGAVGQALSFDGADDKVTCGTGSSLNITGTVITISAWIYPKGWGGGNYGRIVDKINAGGAGYMFMIDNVDATGGIAFGINSVLLDGTDYGRTGSNALSLNIWQHVTVVYNGSGNLSFYVNGLNIPPIHNATASISDNASVPCAIGGRNSDNSRLFDGLIDEVRIYNRALSASEIKRLYKIGGTMKINKPTYSGSLTSGLVGNWTFDGPDMAGVTAYDRSPVGTNHGALTGGPARALGAVGQALSFDGVDDLVNAQSDTTIDNLTRKSICAWIKPKQFNFRDIVSKMVDTSNGWVFRLAQNCPSGDRLCYYHKFSTSAGYWSTTGITNDVWNHACVTFDSSSSANDPKLYINGESKTATESITPAGDSSEETTANLIIGNLRTNLDDPSFDGLIDEVRVYNRVLSASEIKRLYEAGR